MKILEQYTDSTYAMLRIASGTIFTFHGVQKIFGNKSEAVSLWVFFKVCV